jgi:hypothetical protein
LFSNDVDILDDPFILIDDNDVFMEENGLSNIFEDTLESIEEDQNYVIGNLKQPELENEDYFSDFDISENQKSNDGDILDSITREDSLNIRYSKNKRSSNPIFNISYDELPFYKTKSPYFFDLQHNTNIKNINNIITALKKNIGFSSSSQTRDHSKRFIVMLN